MAETLDRCSYEFEPAAWEREHGRCFVDEDEDILTETGDGDVVWQCPHKAIDSKNLCQFHLPPNADAKPDADTIAEEFVAIVNRNRTTLDDDEPRPVRFIGATFESLALDVDQIGDGHHIDLRHAEFESSDWSETTVRTEQLDARGIHVRQNWNSQSAVFAGEAWFEGAEFDEVALFEGAEFGEAARFDRAEFGEAARFDRAEFGEVAWFKGAKFGRWAGFDGAEFGREAGFEGAEFTGGAGFKDAKFGRVAGFDRAEFHGEALFRGVEFDRRARFDGGEFGGAAWFDGGDFGEVAWFKGAKFGGWARFERAEFSGRALFNGVEFGGAAWFEEAEFGGRARFKSVEFGGTAWFEEAEFGGAAWFDGAEFSNSAVFNIATFGDEAVFTTEEYTDGLFQDDVAFRGITADDPILFVDNNDSDEAGKPYSFLGAADFSGADIPNAEFSGVSFSEPPKFDDANLRGADVSDIPLDRASFEGADLTRTDFSEAIVTNATFSGAILERASLYGTDFRNARLYGVRLAGSHISDHTDFGIRDQSERRVSINPRNGPWPAVRYDPRNPDYDQYAGDEDKQGAASISDYSRAASVYAEIQRIAETNAAADLASRCFRWRKDMQRKRYASDEGRGNSTDRLRWFWAELSNLFARYGDSPWRVVATSVVAVLLFGLVYPVVGGMQSTVGDARVFAFDTLLAIPESPLAWIVVLLANLYFSAVTFTTLGYGDIRPYGPVSQALASVESFLGATLLALLVAVLARRITR
jgi:uncharacterized protein YjbI with pentapeptide repeats